MEQNTHHRDQSTATEQTLASSEPGFDPERPFGAHLRMAWWKPLVLIVLLPLVLIGLQVLALVLAGASRDGDDLFSPELTPLRAMAINLSIGATGVLGVLLLRWMTGAPWRAFFAVGRRFDLRRLGRYSVGAAVLVGAAMAAATVFTPESLGWGDFALTGTTVAFLAVTILTTPIQAIGEELTYRSAILPAAASWMRQTRPALVVGLVVSAVVFAAAHGSTDPWLASYFIVFALSTGLMAIISNGIEAPIALHVVNNVAAGIMGNLFSGGRNTTIDRGSESGDAALLFLVAVNVLMVAFVWLSERRKPHHHG